MNIDSRHFDKNSVRRAIAVMLCVIVNVALSRMIYYYEIPLYLDTIGTITASALGGLLPGIMTAVLTNILCSFYNS